MRGREYKEVHDPKTGSGGREKRTRNAEKYFAFLIKSWTLVARSRPRRHAWRVSIVSSMF